MKQWHQLDLMQSIGTSLKTDNCAGTSALIFYRPDDLLMTTQQCQSTEGNSCVIIKNNSNINNCGVMMMMTCIVQWGR